MINPMTFDSVGNDENLTWARDEAAVMDAILSARTSTPLLLNRYTNKENIETNGRGSSPVYITDFRASLYHAKEEQPSVQIAGEKKQELTIELLRGYIAGRYFEITNETTQPRYWGGKSTGSNRFDNGLGWLVISAIGWPNPNDENDKPLLLTEKYHGQQDTTFAINNVARDQQQRRPEMFPDAYRPTIGAVVPIYWNPDTPVGEASQVAITFENVGAVATTDDPLDPYFLNITGAYVFVESWLGKVVSGVTSETDFTTLGNKQTGLWGFSTVELHDFDLSTVEIVNNNQTVTLLPTVEQELETRQKWENFGNFARFTDKAPYIRDYTAEQAELVLSGAVGIPTKPIQPAKALTVGQYFDVCAYGKTSQSYAEFNKQNETGGTFEPLRIRLPQQSYKNIINHAGFDGSREQIPIGYKWQAIGRHHERGALAPSSSTIIDDANKVSNKYEFYSIDPKLSDFKISVVNVKYLSVSELKQQNPSATIQQPGSWAPSSGVDYAVVNVSVDVVPVVTFEHRKNNTKTNDKPTTFIGAGYSRKIVVPLSNVQIIEKNNNGSYTTRVRGLNRAANFKQDLQRYGHTEAKFWAAYCLPIVAAEYIQALTLANVDRHQYIDITQAQHDIWELVGNLAAVYQFNKGINQNKKALQ